MSKHNSPFLLTQKIITSTGNPPDPKGQSVSFCEKFYFFYGTLNIEWSLGASIRMNTRNRLFMFYLTKPSHRRRQIGWLHIGQICTERKDAVYSLMMAPLLQGRPLSGIRMCHFSGRNTWLERLILQNKDKLPRIFEHLPCKWEAQHLYRLWWFANSLREDISGDSSTREATSTSKSMLNPWLILRLRDKAQRSAWEREIVFEQMFSLWFIGYSQDSEYTTYS